MVTDSDTSKYSSPVVSRIFGDRIKRRHYYQQVHGPLDGLDENAEGLSFACEDDDDDNDADDEMPVIHRRRTKKGTSDIPETEHRRVTERQTIRQRMKEYLAANFDPSSSDDDSSDNDTSATDGETLFVTQATPHRLSLNSGAISDEENRRAPYIDTATVTGNNSRRVGPSALSKDSKEQITLLADSRVDSLSPIRHSKGSASQLDETSTNLTHGSPQLRKGDTRFTGSLKTGSKQETGDLDRRSDNQAFDRASKPVNLSSHTTRQQAISLSSFRATEPAGKQIRIPPSSDSEPKAPDEVGCSSKERRTSNRISAKPALNYNIENWFNDLLFDSQPASSGVKKRPVQKNRQLTPMPSAHNKRYSPIVLVSPRKSQTRKFIPETPPRDLQPNPSKVYTVTKYEVMEYLPPALRSNQKVDVVKHATASQDNLQMRPLSSGKRRAVDDSDPWRVPSSSENEREKDSVGDKPTDESNPARDGYIQQPEASPHKTSSSSTAGSPPPLDALSRCFDMQAIDASSPATLTGRTAPDIEELKPPKQRLWQLLSQFRDTSIADILAKLDLAPESDAKSARIRLWYYLDRYSDETADRLSSHLQASIAKHALRVETETGEKCKREDSMSPQDRDIDAVQEPMNSSYAASEIERRSQVYNTGVVEQEGSQGRANLSRTRGVGRKRKRMSMEERIRGGWLYVRRRK